MQHESVWLRFSANFHNRFMIFQTINNCEVILPARSMHQALELVHTRGMSSVLLFPPPTPVAPAFQVMKSRRRYTQMRAHEHASALIASNTQNCLRCFLFGSTSLLLTHFSASNGDSIQSPTERAADAGGATHSRGHPSLPRRHLQPSRYA